ncbi:hypothetical protein niasHT_017084 [Heterodera trifolii]|uniref:Uncharacterized protein n=1 Tax=Heterodera trifolii TaxID=157864 RepID=A0ABD2KY09_9BILA
MFGRRWIWDSSKPTNQLEWAPPMRIIAVITLLASTLDLMADFLLCSRLAEYLHNFQVFAALCPFRLSLPFPTEFARYCALGYFFFTGVSILVYVFEMVDVCLTLKYDEENVFFARMAKSMVLVLEEVPLPALLYLLFTSEPRLSLANPMHIASWIKLITLSWAIVKFAKLRFFWPLLPFNPKHDKRENIRRCFHLNLYRMTMIVVNAFHLLAIFIVINNLVVSRRGGRPIQAQSSL